MQKITVENQVIKRIYGRGRGWAFSAIDFVQLETRPIIDLALSRLCKKQTIRRVIRGIYDYPKYSKLLKQEMGPDMNQVAFALARKFGWYIQISGPTALNYLGLSTQIPGRYIYVSNGPNRKYAINKQTLEFQHRPLKESGFKLRESPVIVQALKSLGEDNITEDAIGKIRNWLDQSLRSKLLSDTKTATGWVYQAITASVRTKNMDKSQPCLTKSAVSFFKNRRQKEHECDRKL